MQSGDFLLDISGQVAHQQYRVQRNDDRPDARFFASHNDEGQNGEYLHDKKITVRPPTKYEQSILDRIPARQKANIVQKQVIGGREYKGAGFLAEPQVIRFADFVVGEVYKVKVQITNVSQTFNAFKVMEMPPNVRDLFDVIYSPQSMMSAGMTCTITVVFSPKENIDVETYVPLLAQTGAIQIPVQCTRKRALISVSQNSLDFGAVVVAEKGEQVVVVKNSGALPTKLTIGGDILQILRLTHKTTAGKLQKIFHFTPEVDPDKPLVPILLRPFSSLKLTLSFSPMELCSIESSIFMSFESSEVEDQVVLISARSVDVPVFVDSGDVNFGCCYYGELYRDKFSVRNTTKSAVKVTPELPAALREMIEYVPKFGFVQPDGATFEFQIKFTPSIAAGQEIDMQIKIVVADQAMPIFLNIKASLSQRELVIDPLQLQYGVCVMTESLSQQLTITNKCRLPRTIGFIRKPPNITLAPSSILSLAPNESVKLDVALKPLTVGHFTQSLQLRTENDDQYTIPVTGHGKLPAISFSSSALKLPSCPVGSTVSSSTILKNDSATSQRFSFSLNPRYGVTISPMSGELAKGQSVPLVVSFAPTSRAIDFTIPAEISEEETLKQEEEARPPSKQAGKKKNKAEEEAERKEKERLEEERKAQIAKQKEEREKLIKELSELEPWEESANDEEWSKHRELLVPCFIENWPCKAIFLNVRCTVVKPTLVAYISKAAKEEAALSVEFGEVPAQHAVSRAVTIANKGSQRADIAVRALDPFGPFKVTKPPPLSLNRGQRCEMIIQFTPNTKAVFLEDIIVASPTSNDIILHCAGEGLPATLSISLEKSGQCSESLNLSVGMGHCLVADKTELPLYFTNMSPFPLSVETQFQPSTVSNFNPNAQIPFALHPHRFTIPANGKIDVSANFLPGAECEYSATALIRFGGEGSTKRLTFSGFGWSKGMYALFPVASPSSVWQQRRDSFQVFNDCDVHPGSTAADPIVIPFTSHGGEAAVQVIVVGNVKGSANGDYSLEGVTDADIKNGWKVESAKANVAAASKQNLTITFTPTQYLLDSLPLKGIGVVSLCNTRLFVKGGSPPTDTTFFIQLKGVSWQ